MMKIDVTKTANPKVKPDPANVPFGVAFTDHMFQMDYSDEKGWHNPRIVPYGDIHLNPGALVFHYGAEVFEGLKAYRTPNGQVQGCAIGFRNPIFFHGNKCFQGFHCHFLIQLRQTQSFCRIVHTGDICIGAEHPGKAGGAG